MAVVAVSSVLLVSLPERAATAPSHETVSGVEQPSEASASSQPPEEPEYAYILKEHEGRVAVFTAENPDEPEMILDTLVKYLPDYDRIQMQEGIPVKDLKTLAALIEDYVS